MILRLRLIGVIAATLVCTASARAAWLPIDDFSSYTLETDFNEGFGPWAVFASNDAGSDTRVWDIRDDPEESGNNTLYMEGEFNRTLQRSFPGAANIPTDGVGTLFFRFRNADFTVGNGPSVGVGLSDAASETLASPAGPGNSASFTNINAVSNGNTGGTAEGMNTIRAYDASGNSDISFSLSTDVWYNTWFVTDHTDDSYRVYIQGGTAYPTMTELVDAEGDPLQFRQTSPELGVIDRLKLRPNNNNSSGNAMFFDDFYFSSGVNLGNPVPEPSSIAIVTVCAVAMLGVSSRRK